MYIERIKNRTSPPAILLRESSRVDGVVKKKTLVNLSKLPEDKIALIEKAIKGKLVEQNLNPKADISLGKAFTHGHVEAVLTAIRKIGLDKIIDPRNSKEKDIIIATIASKIFNRKSKLSTVNECNIKTASSSLGLELGLQDLTDNDIYKAMDWLFDRIDKIEDKLIKKYVQEKEAFLLFDSSSSYYYGDKCPLADYGYSRDKKRGLKQINYGVITNRDGIPVSFQIFKGNTADTESFKSMKKEIAPKVAGKDIIYVGDRGSIRSTVTKELSIEEGEFWLSAITNKTIIKLNEAGFIDVTLFDERDLFEIAHEDYKDERLIVCRNPDLAWKRAETRTTLLKKTESLLEEYQKTLEKKSEKQKKKINKTTIAYKVGQKASKFKMQKHFLFEYTDNSFSFKRDEDNIKKEEKTDGIYVLRTSVKKESMSESEVLNTYKSLSKVERFFRSLKSDLIKIRPIRHWKEERVRAHGFISMLTYIVEWHLKKCWKDIMFIDQSPLKIKNGIRAERSSIAKRKDLKKKNENGDIVQSYFDILDMLKGVVKSELIIRGVKDANCWQTSEKSTLQQKAMDLLKNICTQ